MAENQLPRRARRPLREGHEATTGCGVVMPISATGNHPETFWKDVIKLVHRCISRAGFEPKNVWESSATDRISERIIGNLFNLAIVVIDITDLNPNVMFELGLRLSSKKPTIVISSNMVKIPFDISDFEVLFYPDDLNMLLMEDFMSRLEKALKDRYASFQSDQYVPFLSNVIVDVASPQTREVELNDLILTRIDELSRKVSALETPRALTNQSSRPRIRAPLERGYHYVDIPIDSKAEFEARAIELFAVDDLDEIHSSEDIITFRVVMSAPSIAASIPELMELVTELGGSEGVPF